MERPGNENFLRVNVYFENVFFKLIKVDYGTSIGMIEEYHTKNYWKDSELIMI